MGSNMWTSGWWEANIVGKVEESFFRRFFFGIWIMADYFNNAADGNDEYKWKRKKKLLETDVFFPWWMYSYTNITYCWKIGSTEIFYTSRAYHHTRVSYMSTLHSCTALENYHFPVQIEIGSGNICSYRLFFSVCFHFSCFLIETCAATTDTYSSSLGGMPKWPRIGS